MHQQGIGGTLPLPRNPVQAVTQFLVGHGPPRDLVLSVTLRHFKLSTDRTKVMRLDRFACTASGGASPRRAPCGPC